jgi:hypothetical protein
MLCGTARPKQSAAASLGGRVCDHRLRGLSDRKKLERRLNLVGRIECDVFSWHAGQTVPYWVRSALKGACIPLNPHTPDIEAPITLPRNVRILRVSVVNSILLPLIHPWSLPCWFGP